MANITRTASREYSELMWPNAMWRWPTRSGTDSRRRAACFFSFEPTVFSAKMSPPERAPRGSTIAAYDNVVGTAPTSLISKYPVSMTSVRRLLAEPGPTQSEWLIHFCGRKIGAARSPGLDGAIAAMTPGERLYNMLWTKQIRGSAPFGAATPVVCLSECSIEHMKWLIGQRGWQPWGVMFRRQYIYDVGGGPVWYCRTEQYDALSSDLRHWAVRLETEPYRSDWLHEREWRMAAPQLPIPLERTSAEGPDVAVLIGDPSWQPLSVSGELPALWHNSYRGYWDAETGQIISLSGS